MIKTEIILNGTYLDLIDDVSMPLSYQIADIKDPSKKNTNFSKTITLPGTRINNKIFGWIWDTNISVTSSGTTNFTPTFNPNKKADVVIIYDGAEIFKGFMKLDKIKVLNDYKIEYDVTCFGKLKDLFLELGEKTMADLNLSKYNHPYTYDVQKASWDNYIYKNGTTVPFSKGDGYVYPMVDYALNDNQNWKTEHFFPAVYYKTIINEIITQAGYKYDGSIFNDNDFKSLVVSYGSGDLKLSTQQVTNKIFQATKSADEYIDLSFGALFQPVTNRNQPRTLLFDDETTPPNADVGNNFDGYTYTAPTNGFYDFSSIINLSFTHFPSSGTSTINVGGNPGIFMGYFSFRKNSVDITTIPVFIAPTNVSDYSVGLSGGYMFFLNSTVTSGTTSSTFNFTFNQQITLNAGDYIRLEFFRTKGTYYTTVNLNIYGENPAVLNSYIRLNVEANSLFKNNMASTSVVEGETVEMSNLFGSQLKQKDFISSFFKLFNIYTETDKYDPYLLHFEPRNNFYASSGTIRDWDNKLDYSQNYEIIPMGDLDAKTYLYKFKDDTDYWNDYYKKKYTETYGQRKYVVDNDWVTKENKTEVIFAPTPLVNRIGDDKILPRILQMNSNGAPQPLSNNANKASNLRLWYYGGVKTTSGYNFIRTSGTTNETSYGYAGHIDNITNPNFDVNFGVPIEVYYTANTYTNNNLFNKYYKQFIEEISSKDSKIFKGQFHLNPVDIAILNFRDLFYFHGSYWILNKIYDYNPKETGKTTTCEFIKLKAGIPFQPTQKNINGGKGDSIGSDVSPSFNDSIPRDGNILDSNVLVSGSDNVINSGVKDSVIVGSGNKITSASQNITLLNSSGTTVLANTKNVTLINTYDLEVNESYNNDILINGKIYGGKNVIYKTNTYTFDGTERNTFAAFVITANRKCYLPFPSQIFNGYTIEIKNANNSAFVLEVNIQSDSSTPTWSLGDGTTATTHNLSAGDSFEYTYYDTVWYIR